MKKPMSEEAKRENQKKFIEATQELLQYTAAKNVSIRKIADAAGFHNSTIYLYFNDVEDLISIASVKYFAEYSKELADIDPSEYDDFNYFMKVWELFCNVAFSNADIFYQFFFGKHSQDISVILNKYYDIYPEEKQVMSANLTKMYFGDNIYERCLYLLKPLAGSDYTKITDSNLHLINSTIVYVLKGMLKELARDHSLSIPDYIDKFMAILKIIIS